MEEREGQEIQYIDLEVRAEYSMMHRALAVYVYGRDPLHQMQRVVVTDFVFERPEPGTFRETPIFIKDTEVQQLVDDLWRAGFRPTEGAGSAGSLAATQAHLEDMRKVALDLFEIFKRQTDTPTITFNGTWEPESS